MLIFVSGGVRSGKSALGERLVLGHAGGRKVYLATSEITDEEMEARIARHRADRAGKGFVTVEKSRGIGSEAETLQPGDAVLLDCLGNLTANEMFGSDTPGEEPVDALVHRVFSDIMQVCKAVSLLVVISNEVFSDSVRYDPDTERYREALGALHRLIAAEADEAYECICGLTIKHKG